MTVQELTAELTDLRDSIGQHMEALSGMSPEAQREMFLADLERVRRFTGKLEQAEQA
ncbi:MAG: hypothetical protein HFF90_08525 [Oscillibacter sp.]|nr:hypothetical protein [Oscillibacter sp.]